MFLRISRYFCSQHFQGRFIVNSTGVDQTDQQNQDSEYQDLSTNDVKVGDKVDLEIEVSYEYAGSYRKNETGYRGHDA